MDDPVGISTTDAAIASVAQSPSPRVRQVSEAVIRHLHDLVREVHPTYEEWWTVIDLLTRTGQKCTDKRQEFVLMSDTLGVSMLVDAVNNRAERGETESTVLGPFYVEDPPEHELGADLGKGNSGETLLVEGCVRAASGAPLPGALVDTWQSDADGFYDVQRGDDLDLRGRFRTDREGRFWFWSVVPSSYPVPTDGPVGEMLRAQGRHPFRPAHVHFKIAADGFRRLVTHTFIAGDRYLDSDAVFGVKESLVRELDSMEPGRASDGRVLDSPYKRLSYEFVLAEAT
jgi:hydroxyquinol 1,2-dioxygenase